MKFFSIAALALVGAVITSCSSSDDLTENAQQPQPASGSKVETFTTTVSLDGGETRALDGSGHKTFAVGETMALIYNNGTSTVKAVSHALETGDITNSGKSATFTFDLETPNKEIGVMYIYPAAMATETGSHINYDALYTQQDGTLTKLASNFDLCLKAGTWSDGNLPSPTLENHLAILALTLKNDADGSNITNSITGLTVSDGSNTYNVTRKTGNGPIYVAILETSSATIEVTATDGTKTYAKALSGRTYEHNNGYNISWRMAEVIKGKFSVSSTKQVYFSKGNLRANYNGSSWAWSFAPYQWSHIGSATANTNINGNGTVSTNGTVDLFGWSTSQTYLGIHNSTNNNDYRGDFVEWGSHADVTKTIGTGWRTMTSSEWRYLISTRTTTSGIRYCKAKVGEHFGLIVLPDDWNTDNYTLVDYNETSNRDFNDGAINNKISLDDWANKFEAHGAVFLPTTGQRNTGNVIDAPNGRLYYWSSTSGPNTSGESANAVRMTIAGTWFKTDEAGGRRFGYSVRLVRDVK